MKQKHKFCIYESIFYTFMITKILTITKFTTEQNEIYISRRIIFILLTTTVFNTISITTTMQIYILLIYIIFIDKYIFY